MTPSFGNCAYSYLNPKRKRVFVPSDDGRAIGYELKALAEAKFTPDPSFYHLAEGGHVAAMHIHRRQKYFSRLDFANFFYSVARNRVARALREIGLARAEHYAKWSCVKKSL